MIKRVYKILIIILLMIFFFTPKVYADLGPKPTAEITVKGIEGEYYFDLLVLTNNVETLTEDEIKDQLISYYREDYPQVLNGFQDYDGYASYTLYTRIPSSVNLVTSNVFFIGYYSAPSQFKIMLYTEEEVLLVSKVINRKMFNSIIVFDVSDVNKTYDQFDVGTVTEELYISKIALDWLIRLILTIIIEVGILFLFAYRLKNSYRLVLLTNLITQTLLTIFILYGYYALGMMLTALFFLIIGEILVLLIEAIVYRKYLKEKSKLHAITYAIIANLITFLLTFILLINMI